MHWVKWAPCQPNPVHTCAKIYDTFSSCFTDQTRTRLRRKREVLTLMQKGKSWFDFTPQSVALAVRGSVSEGSS